MCALALSALAWGCCPDGEIRRVEPEEGAASVDYIQLAFYWDGDRLAGPGACKGYWAVNEVEGGSEALGTIDACGRYTPPKDNPREVKIYAASYRPYECADCCPYAVRAVRPKGAD